MDRSTQGEEGMGSGVYKPCGIAFDLALLQTIHLEQIKCMSCFIFGQ